MPFHHLDIKPVEHITVGAVGEPGKRTFYLQASGGGRLISLRIEKSQVQMFALTVEQFLAELQERFPDLDEAEGSYEESDMALEEPIEPAFHAGNMGLGYDEVADRLLLVVREIVGDESQTENASEASFWCTRSQVRKAARWSVELVKRGRPICGNCGNPIDPEGHFCVRRNGHKH